MKKMLAILLIVTLSMNVVFAEAIPPLPIRDCSSYDCLADFVLYWFSFQKSSTTLNVLGLKIELSGRDQYKTADKGAAGFLSEVIIPLVALTLITFGFMSQLKIFGRKLDWINPTLSFLMVIISLRVGIFRSLVGLVFAVGPGYAFILWAILFFTGLWFIFRKTHTGMKTDAVVSEIGLKHIQELNDEWNELIEKEADLVDRLGEETDATKQAEINKHLEKIKERKKQIEDQQKNIRRQI